MIVIFLCYLDLNIYKCVSNDIVTNEVIITKERMKHASDSHPEVSDYCSDILADAICYPDFIIESHKAHSALILKESSLKERKIKIVLRLVTSSDSNKWKNSVITFHIISDKEWRRLIKNKIVLYCRDSE